jgi:hypothetical protein
MASIARFGPRSEAREFTFPEARSFREGLPQQALHPPNLHQLPVGPEWGIIKV